MRIHTPTPYPRETGDFAVRTHPGNDGDPFAIIALDEGDQTEICLDSLDDADRLIRAVVDAKRKLEVSIKGERHQFRPDARRRCDECGQIARAGIHAEPAPVLEDEADAATVLAEAIANGTPVIVADDEDANVHWGNSGGGIPAPVLEGTVAAPPQDAPHAPRLRRVRACGRCKNAPAVHFIETGAFCEPCVDRCHEATEFDHVCAVCATPAEASRM